MNRIKVVLIYIFGVIACNHSAKNSIYVEQMEGLFNNTVNLSNLKSNKYNIFIAFSNNCPLCKASIPNLNIIANQYPQLSIVLFYPENPKDAGINKYIKGLLAPNILLVKDVNRRFTNALNAKVTPQAFVVDTLGKIKYSGPIDNSMLPDFRKNLAHINFYLNNALDTLVNKKQNLINDKVEAMGCYIE